MWPASALLTGNGVAFVLRVPGHRARRLVEHERLVDLRGDGRRRAALEVRDHASGAGTSSTRRTSGSSLCFVLLGPERADPLAFWWGPMSVWLALALALIVGGGLAILSRLHLARDRGRLLAHVRGGRRGARRDRARDDGGAGTSARSPGVDLWWLLVTSPEVLVFLFFMITDPRTIPEGPRGRRVYAVSVGLLATLLIAPLDDRVRGEAGRARRAHDRLRRAAAARCCSPAGPASAA